MLRRDDSYKVAVVIVTYNAMRWLERCFTSLRSSTIPLNVIVIDNGSTDGTQQKLKTDFSEVEFIQSEKNLGFGPANNIGIKLAYEKGAEHVLLLNQDTWIEPEVVEKLISASLQHPEFGIISPIHLNGDGDLLDNNFGLILSRNTGRLLLGDSVKGNYSKMVYDVPFVMAACWFVTKTCIEKVGFFDPLFYHYGEDDNYCQRALFHGYKIGIVPTAFIYHDREDKIQEGFRNGFPWQNEDLQLRVKYANLHYVNWEQEYDELVLSNTKNATKSMYNLRFKQASEYSKKVEMLKRLKLEIIASRNRNSVSYV